MLHTLEKSRHDTEDRLEKDENDDDELAPVLRCL